MRSVTCLHGLQRGGAGPQRLDHHGLDGEGRVLLAAELAILQQAGQRDDQHEVDDEALVLERPPGEVEILHWLVLLPCSGLGKAHLLTFAQRVDAGGDDDVALGKTAGDDDGVGLVARDGDRP